MLMNFFLCFLTRCQEEREDTNEPDGGFETDYKVINMCTLVMREILLCNNNNNNNNNNNDDDDDDDVNNNNNKSHIHT